ncbi:hypothetical protein SDC9_70337 [bioreactor metagenome]|uniref:Polymerase nucleotidyl transferase domain-containing protein n=1 Tax=bioreactor metagenome TaxID=1076179 RepID=A0A644Y5Y3_9ZZZZ|nr:DUF4111 domain-containing protein [Oscillospiraceae bacterium]
MQENLQLALTEFSKETQRLFGDELVGIYLTGSIALGSYHYRKSDIDFTVLVRSPLSDDYFKHLEDLHKELVVAFPHQKFEGHYISNNDLGKQPNEIQPVFTIHDAKLSKSHHDINSVTWFTLKNYGITVWGTPASELDLNISTEDLSKYVIENLNSYWSYWLFSTKKPLSIKWLYALHHSSIEWGVMGVCRMFYTLFEQDVASKDNATKYTLSHVPDKYKRILREAIYIRTGQGKRQYYSPLIRMYDMINFLEYMIHECNRIYNV